jgi:hypothetical protein
LPHRRGGGLLFLLVAAQRVDCLLLPCRRLQLRATCCVEVLPLLPLLRRRCRRWGRGWLGLLKLALPHRRGGGLLFLLVAAECVDCLLLPCCSARRCWLPLLLPSRGPRVGAGAAGEARYSCCACIETSIILSIQPRCRWLDSCARGLTAMRAD